MELDNLKAIWQEQELLPGDDPLQEGLLIALLQERSRGPIERMRRNLRFESILILVSYIPTIIAYLTMFRGEFRIISVMMALILLFFLGYYALKNRLLKRMQCVSCEVRSNLARQLGVLGKYIRFHLWSSTIVTVGALGVAFLILDYSWMEVHHEQPSFWWLQPVFLVTFLALFGLGSFFLNRWYIHKLYGRHIKKLKQLLREMDEG
jgi:hypothetical protein